MLLLLGRCSYWLLLLVGSCVGGVLDQAEFLVLGGAGFGKFGMIRLSFCLLSAGLSCEEVVLLGLVSGCTAFLLLAIHGSGTNDLSLAS